MSDEQSVEMPLILREHERQTIALRDKAMAFMNPEICALRVQHQEDILAILNENQAELFRQIREGRSKRTALRTRRRGVDRIECPN